MWLLLHLIRQILSPHYLFSNKKFLLSLFNFALPQVVLKFFTTNNFILYLDHFLQMRILLVFTMHEIPSTRKSTT